MDTERPYSNEDVDRLRGSLQVEHTLARRGANRLRELLDGEGPVQALGASTGNQAVQQVKAGLEAIYLSGWQVAADANLAGEMYPDQSLYPADSVPSVVRRINRALRRADQIEHSEGNDGIDDLIWCETAEPDMEEAEQFAAAIHDEFPERMLAYNCSPSFNWKSKLSDDEIEGFVKRLGDLGYRFQFITLAGFHTLNHSMFELARGYRDHGMTAYAELQQREFANEEHGYTATSHQREVGAGYFDEVAEIISGGKSSTGALSGSTEEAQFS
jgi:isocitrate lyase